MIEKTGFSGTTKYRECLYLGHAHACLSLSAARNPPAQYRSGRTYGEQHQLRLLTEPERAANKELEGFSCSVSHDLRSPLRAINGFARILQDDYAGRLDGGGRRLLNVIRDSSNRMGSLIDDLLAFSRLGRKSMAAMKIDMTALAQGVSDE